MPTEASLTAPVAAVFRPARASDLCAIVALLGDLFAIERDFQPAPARQYAALQRLLAQGESLLLVACGGPDACVLGFCSVQRLVSTAAGGPVGLVEDVVVHAAWRGRGIGRGLLVAAEVWAREHGLLRLQLLADEANPAAHAFYRRLGWQRGNMRNWRVSPLA